MSWIVAVIGPAEALAHGVTVCHAEPRHRAVAPGLVVAAGGHPDTLHADIDPDGLRGIVVAGTGLRIGAERSEILSVRDWSTFKLPSGNDPSKLDGHFIGIRWEPGRVEWFSDQIGLRTVYTSSHGGITFCSTRLDWLVRTMPSVDLDLQALGSRWLCYHPFQTGSGVRSVETLGSAGRMEFKDGLLRGLWTEPFLPVFDGSADERPDRVVAAVLTSPFSTPSVPSLGLSGGVDSRLLLALLGRDATGRFVAHSFGSSKDPDVSLAERLARTTGVEHQRIEPFQPAPDELVPMLRSYATATHLTEPVTSALRLAGYDRLVRQRRFLVDGGFGELLRRQYFNRLVTFGRTALRQKDARRLLSVVRSGRADIFSDDASEVLERGAIDQLTHALGSLPQVDEIGVENAADLLAVRTRLPNYGGPEQARLDGIMLNLMPLAQPTVIRSAFRLPPRRRRSGSWVIETIGRCDARLARIPVAKGGLTHRLGLPTIAAGLLTAVRTRWGGAYLDETPDLLLDRLRSVVMDLALSASVRRSTVTDATRIDRIVEGYYGGDRSLRGPLAWWITFEWWRQGLQERTADAEAGGRMHVVRPPRGRDEVR